MADGTRAVMRGGQPCRPPSDQAAAAVLGAVAVIALGALGGLAAEAWSSLDRIATVFSPRFVAIARFTLEQALVSTVLSVGLAVPVAHALDRHREFAGRGPILAVFAVPLALPALVAAIALIALYGRAGFVADLWNPLFEERWPGLYGLSGILVAHVFFNLPFAVRGLLAALDAIPPDTRRLGAQLGLKGWTRFRLMEWPVMRGALPGLAVLVFVLCATSFTLVLVLGGGPRATTLEVAIYQALRFDFRPLDAMVYAGVQLAFGLAFALLLARVALPPEPTAMSAVRIVDTRATRGETLFSITSLALALLFVGGPLAAVLADGLSADLAGLAVDPAVLKAALTSVAIAIPAALLSVGAAVALLAAAFRRRVGSPPRLAAMARWLASEGSGLILVLSPVMIGAGWFILLRRQIDPFAAAPVMIVAVNALMALPFSLRMIAPAMRESASHNDRLAQTLGLHGFRRFARVEWQTTRPALLPAFGFAFALSLGDLGAVALWGSNTLETLPWLLYNRLGAYRSDDAAGLALILALVCGLAVILSDRAGRRRS